MWLLVLSFIGNCLSSRHSLELLFLSGINQLRLRCRYVHSFLSVVFSWRRWKNVSLNLFNLVVWKASHYLFLNRWLRFLQSLRNSTELTKRLAVGFFPERKSPERGDEGELVSNKFPLLWTKIDSLFESKVALLKTLWCCWVIGNLGYKGR